MVIPIEYGIGVMIGKTTLNYRILQKLGSPREILVSLVLINNKSIISPGNPYEIPEESYSVLESQIVISRCKGGSE